MMTVRRLDDILAPLEEDVQLMKIDVEGFETEVLKGAPRVLSRVRYLMTECNVPIIGEEGKNNYLRFLHEQGFAISTTNNFQAPFYAEADILAGTVQLSDVNLFCVNRRLVLGQQ
jgi:hypothetical protein